MHSIQCKIHLDQYTIKFLNRTSKFPPKPMRKINDVASIQSTNCKTSFVKTSCVSVDPLHVKLNMAIFPRPFLSQQLKSSPLERLADFFPPPRRWFPAFAPVFSRLGAMVSGHEEA